MSSIHYGLDSVSGEQHEKIVKYINQSFQIITSLIKRNLNVCSQEVTEEPVI